MDFAPLLDQWPLIAGGLIMTLVASLFGSILALLIGLFLGLASQCGSRVTCFAVRGFVYVFRGIPSLVLIFLTFYALPEYGIVLPPLIAGILALGLTSGAYMAEVVRAGLESVDVSQSEAAALDGAGRWTTLARILLPQASQQMVAPLTNEVTALIMASSLLSVISVGEATSAAELIASEALIPVEAFLTLAVLYLVINTIVTRASILFERWLERSIFFGDQRMRQLPEDAAAGNSSMSGYGD